MNLESSVALQANFKQIRALYSGEAYQPAAREAGSLLKELLAYIFKSKYFDNLNSTEQRDVLDALKNIPDLPNSFKDYNLKQFSQVFGKTNCQSEVTTTELSRLLVGSFDLESMADLVAYCQKSLGDINPKLLRIAIQQIIQLTTIFSYLTDTISLTERDYLDGESDQSSDTSFENLERSGFKQTFFLYNEERGLLLNRADRTRNIAFKVETFYNLLTTIYKAIIKQLSDSVHGEDAELTDEAYNGMPSLKTARNVIMFAGLDSGKRFGRALFTQLQMEGVRMDMKARINKWCEFDSDVGFGRFNADQIHIGDDNQIEGSIALKENFLTVGRNFKSHNICCFMKGYIRGVLQELVGMPLDVSHRRRHCSQYNIDEDTCVFHISIDEDEYAETKEKLSKMDPDEEL